MMNKTKILEAKLDDMMPLIRERLASGRSVQFMPHGTSMLPMLRPGRDSVVLSPLPEQLKKYDVVLYQRENGSYVLHRINIPGDTYVCMGDNQFRYETGIRKEQIVGIVSAFFRDGKKYSVNFWFYRIYCRLWPTRKRVRYCTLTALAFVRGTKRRKQK